MADKKHVDEDEAFRIAEAACLSDDFDTAEKILALVGRFVLTRGEGLGACSAFAVVEQYQTKATRNEAIKNAIQDFVYRPRGA